MQSEFLAYGFILLLVLLLLVVNYIRDRKFLKKSTKDTMKKELKEEIDAERYDDLRRKKKFEESLRRFEA